MFSFFYRNAPAVEEALPVSKSPPVNEGPPAASRVQSPIPGKYAPTLPTTITEEPSVERAATVEEEFPIEEESLVDGELPFGYGFPAQQSPFPPYHEMVDTKHLKADLKVILPNKGLFEVHSWVVAQCSDWLEGIIAILPPEDDGFMYLEFTGFDTVMTLDEFQDVFRFCYSRTLTPAHKEKPLRAYQTASVFEIHEMELLALEELRSQFHAAVHAHDWRKFNHLMRATYKAGAGKYPNKEIMDVAWEAHAELRRLPTAALEAFAMYMAMC